MSRQGRIRRIGLEAEDERPRPLYARVLGLRHLRPGPLPCFLFFEGTIVFGLLLALAELVPWWTIVVLPPAVAAMVKVNDTIAALLARSAALVPEQERERFCRELVLVPAGAKTNAATNASRTPRSSQAAPVAAAAPSSAAAAASSAVAAPAVGSFVAAHASGSSMAGRAPGPAGGHSRGRHRLR